MYHLAPQNFSGVFSSRFASLRSSNQVSTLIVSSFYQDVADGAVAAELLGCAWASISKDQTFPCLASASRSYFNRTRKTARPLRKKRAEVKNLDLNDRAQFLKKVTVEIELDSSPLLLDFRSGERK
jgi:hypothetical protein